VCSAHAGHTQCAYFRAGLVRYSTADSRIAVHVLADRNALRNPLQNMHKTLPPSVKRQNRTDNLLHKDRKENDKMNNQRTKQHICKPHQPTHNRSLQKSCFLANTPVRFCYFRTLNKENLI